MSDIRQLLAAAQEAEVHGQLDDARRLLRQAADWYQARDLRPRAEQMLRHMARLQPSTPRSDEWNLGLDDAIEPIEKENQQVNQLVVDDRGPTLAPDDEGWCSFCCRPVGEVGPLIAGPRGVGAYICAGCIVRAADLREVGRERLPSAANVLLPRLAKLVEGIEGRQARVVLVIGPKGSGKTSLLRALGGPAEPRSMRGDRHAVEFDQTSSEAQREWLDWLDGSDARRLVLSVRGGLGTPRLVLEGEQGPIPLFDTATLQAGVPFASPALLQRVEQVVPLAAFDERDFEGLARQRLNAREVRLPEEALTQLLALARAAPEPLDELFSLIHRLPKGTYRP